MNKKLILIVEDELEIAELLAFHVKRDGFDGRIARTGRQGLASIESARPALILLDLMLPDLDGLEVCRRLKREAETRDIPILIVSAKGDESDIVAGIELGADDYVTKPFSPKVLLARIKNVLRRQEIESQPNQPTGDRTSMADGTLVIDSGRHVVTAFGKPVELTVTEFGILDFLAARPGFVRTRDQIIASVHGDSAVLSRRTVDVHVTSLRKKLGELGGMIQTVRGVGYRLSELATVPEE
jgi:two-component system alkaline phosphatase synthesis response regulator PhoP